MRKNGCGLSTDAFLSYVVPFSTSEWKLSLSRCLIKTLYIRSESFYFSLDILIINIELIHVMPWFDKLKDLKQLLFASNFMLITTENQIKMLNMYFIQ